MKNQSITKIEKLLTKGVKILNPNSVEIGDDVITERISGDDVVIHSGCRIFGSSTLILQGARLGYEGPVTIENCQVGPQVELGGGFFREAVFLEKVIMGSGSHVREGTILEEESSVAHAVGLKQTILFPFVTLGSLINFCDCFMSGGTSRKDHSEVGSSYIHFNYTPNQDKATPSLIGDVPNGVMLNRKPIFLGGQGGLVGPCRLAFGTVAAAGIICRKDELRQGRLLFEAKGRSGNVPFIRGVHRNIKKLMTNNVIYIANLMALKQWYVHVRSQFISYNFPETLLRGLEEKLNIAINERIKRLKEFCRQSELYDKWSELEESFKKLQTEEGDRKLKDIFLEKISFGIRESGSNYISVIKGLKSKDAKSGTIWLQGIVDHATVNLLKIIRRPS